MRTISLIAAIDEQFGLGKDKQLLCHLPADLKYFKQNTLGKPIIMGRKTFESIGRPLPGRHNIVVSRSQRDIVGVTMVNSFEKALAETADGMEVMIIGGASLFQQALPQAQYMYLTKIHHHFKADVFFPDFNEKAWNIKEKSYYPKDNENAYAMTFFLYERIKTF